MTDKDFMDIFSTNMKHWMEIKNVNQVDLSERIGVAQASVSNWYRGEKIPRMDKVDKMCEIFGCKREDLLNEQTMSDEDVLRDNEILNTLQEAFDKRPEMRALFSVAETASKEDIEQAIKIIEALKK